MNREKNFTRLTAAEVESLRKRRQVRVLDVRDASSFLHDHMPGAMHCDSTEMDDIIRRNSRNEAVLVYCYHGLASRIYAQTLADFGFSEVYDLIGGFEAWHHHLTAKALRKRPSQLSEQLASWLERHGFPADDTTATIANGHTALLHACRLGEVAIAAELIHSGAALQDVNDDGNNALWLACFTGNPALIDLLIDSGIDIDRQNNNGASCLMYAASSGKTEVLQSLLDAGADIALTSLDGCTALDMAANLPCLQLLRQAAQRPAIRKAEGKETA